MTWNAIIIEDEPAAANLLKHIIREHFPNIKVLAEAIDVEEAVERIQMHRPDLIFSDIDLGGNTVFDALDQLLDYTGQLIFTTGHDEFALRAFRYNAIDYLLKPISPEMLREVIERLDKKEKQVQLRYEMLRESVQNEKFDKIVLHVSDEYRVIALKDIVRLEGEGNYTNLSLTNNESVYTSKPLKFFEDTLPETQFFRLHQSHIVNLHFIKKILKGDEQKVLLENGITIPLSRRKMPSFVKWLERG